jgi:pSer/pThr/pTyr-binding forkhead associated (FHA) protein
MSNDDHTEIFVNQASDPEQVLLRERAIQLGFLTVSQAAGIFDAYIEGESSINFGSYLLERGMISLEQLNDLQGIPPEAEGFDSAVQAPAMEDTPVIDEAAMLGGTIAPMAATRKFELIDDDGFGLDETMGGAAPPAQPAMQFDVIDDDGFGLDETMGGAAPAPQIAMPAAVQTPAPAADNQTMGGLTMGGLTMGGLTMASDLESTEHPENVPGQILGNIYSGCKITKKLGAGGMGQVFFAQRLVDDVTVVVKFLAPEQANNPTWRKRFLREAHMQIQLKHPNIVELFSVDGVHSQPHLVMELVTGKELTDALEAVGMFAPEEATRIIRDLADALALAHKHGVIHRDIKPQNALVTTEGVVKLLDFGLAKNTEMDDGLSLAGQILGTPQYMAPEQWGDHEVDARCDIFSLGATLYHLLTGTMPFQGSKPRQVARKAKEGDYVEPRELVPDASEDLCIVIHRMMEPQRRFRYTEMTEVVKDLNAILAGEPIEVPRFIEKTGKRRGRRCALVRGHVFKVGRDANHTVPIPNKSVAKNHAEITRGKLGFTLRDLGSENGSFVGNMRVREVILKDGDIVKFGKTVFQFFDGGLEKARTEARITRKLSKSTEVSAENTYQSLMDGLVEVRDRRIVVHLLELLPTEDHAKEAELAWQVMKDLLGGEIAGKVVGRLEARLKRRSVMLPSQLFSITRENLGGDVEAWLSWWDNLRDKYPPQITTFGSKLTKSRLTVVRGEKKPRRIPVADDKSELSMGRDPKADIPIKNRSVSRLHATLLRFHERLGIRDEGSRFGTLLNGNSVRVSFLKNGDQIVLGKARLLFEERRTLDLSGKESGEIVLLPARLYFCLSDLKHGSVAHSLIRFLEMEDETAWFQENAEKLFTDGKPRSNFIEKVKKIYVRHANKAREILPVIFSGQSANSAAEWRVILDAEREDLPPQVQPMGWFPE